MFRNVKPRTELIGGVLGIEVLESLSMTGATLLVAAVATVAAFVPARCASGVDPVEDLQSTECPGQPHRR